MNLALARKCRMWARDVFECSTLLGGRSEPEGRLLRRHCIDVNQRSPALGR
jgi:hypothetical protein